MTRDELIKLLDEANKTLKTIDVEGKDYVEVNQRIRAFRQIYPDGSIETEIVSLQDGLVVMKCTVRDNQGHILATAHAYEKESSSFINETSFIENCCTSATGRALGYCGIGIGTSVASYEEVTNAINNQMSSYVFPSYHVEKISEETWKSLNAFYSKKDIKLMYQELGITNGKEMPEDYARKKCNEHLLKTKEPNKEFY